MTQIYKNNGEDLLKTLLKMHDLEDARTGATCLECLVKIYQKDMPTLI